MSGERGLNPHLGAGHASHAALHHHRLAELWVAAGRFDSVVHG